MKKKFTLWLFSIAISLFILNSCINDDLYSSTNPELKEYTSKSPWKEDEKYIKNVKAIFEENADKDYFFSNFGTISWDYAVTMGTNETFLEAPVIKNNKVDFILVVYREGDKVYFKRKEEESSKEFFNALVFNDRSLLTRSSMGGIPDALQAKSACVSITTTWTWTNDDGSAGPTYVFTEMYCLPSGPALPCQAIDVDAVCGGSGSTGSGGGGGAGGGGYTYPVDNGNTPCGKTQNILSKTQVKQSINTLYNQSKATGANSGEMAFMTTADGTAGSVIQGAEHSANLGNISGYSGYYHNHTQESGIKMFSVRDIFKLFEFIINLPAGTTPDTAFAGVVASEACSGGCADGYEYFNYIIRFNGTAQEAGNVYSAGYDFEYLQSMYRRFEQSISEKPGYSSQNGNYLSSKGLEELFFYTLDKMGIDKNKITLQRVDKENNITTVTLGSDGKPQDTPCS